MTRLTGDLTRLESQDAALTVEVGCLSRLRDWAVFQAVLERRRSQELREECQGRRDAEHRAQILADLRARLEATNGARVVVEAQLTEYRRWTSKVVIDMERRPPLAPWGTMPGPRDLLLE